MSTLYDYFDFTGISIVYLITGIAQTIMISYAYSVKLV